MGQVLSAGKTFILNNAASTPIAAVARNRKSITFAMGLSSTALGIWLGNVPLTANADPNAITAITVDGVSNKTLEYAIHGECVRQAWHAWPTAAASIAVLESYDDGEA